MRRGELGFVAVLVGLALAACNSRDTGVGEFQAGRTYDPANRSLRWETTSSERFGMSASDFAKPSSGDAGPGLSWTTPPGWTELPPAQFRDANFRVAGNERAECYLSTLTGEGGGLAANINRWRMQMSLTPLSALEIEALPRVAWLGKQAVAVDFVGSWTGMSGGGKLDGWRLIGWLLVEPTQSRFLKMTGPADVLEGELEHFRQLALSFGPGAREDGARDDGALQEMPAATPKASGELPAGHPPISSASTSAGSASASASTSNVSPSGFEWSPPAGWKRGPEKAMREITYLVGDDGATECYVTLLAGTGGGTLANINRWCGQLGQTPMPENALSKLEHVKMLGADGVLVEIERGAAATSGAEYLLGAVCEQPERSVFVKMTGPRAVLERERAAFVEFCKSARRAQ
ncbi:MAG: hypothetical protein K8S98_03645 [Planctomycetes bacterium]|nr:hypothetical protein [Planctomycetota bacterium]